eukprot:1668476-Amphidinium_carterae.1
MPAEDVDSDGEHEELNQPREEQAAREMWTCPRCTLLNEPMALCCDACSFRRQPLEEPAPPAAGLRAAGDEGLRNSGSDEARGDQLNQGL